MAQKPLKYRECVKFGKLLKKRREDAGLTQEAFAVKAMVNRSFLATIESGLRNPSLVILVKLSKGFKVKLSELVEGV